jgi:hypothetical protein
MLSAMTSRINRIEKQVGKLDGLEKKIEDLSGLGTQLQQVLAAFNRAGGQVGPLSGSAGSNESAGEGSSVPHRALPSRIGREGWVQKEVEGEKEVAGNEETKY